jgi:hypothetical protein
VSDYRPVCVGMNNPISQAPGHALYPHPPGSTGHRLWQMLEDRAGVTKRGYLAAFDRRNLVIGAEWSRAAGALAAGDMLPRLRDRVVLLLGDEVRRCFGLPWVLIHPVEADGAVFRQLPHPLGKCLWYNDRENRRVAASLLEELYWLGVASLIDGGGWAPVMEHREEAGEFI